LWSSEVLIPYGLFCRAQPVNSYDLWHCSPTLSHTKGCLLEGGWSLLVVTGKEATSLIEGHGFPRSLGLPPSKSLINPYWVDGPSDAFCKPIFMYLGTANSTSLDKRFRSLIFWPPIVPSFCGLLSKGTQWAMTGSSLWVSLKYRFWPFHVYLRNLQWLTAIVNVLLRIHTIYTIYIHIYVHTIPHHNIPYHCIALHIAHCIALHYITLHTYVHIMDNINKYIHVCMYIYMRIYTYIYIYVYGIPGIGDRPIQPELSDPGMSIWRSCTSSASTWSAWNVIRSPVPQPVRQCPSCFQPWGWAGSGSGFPTYTYYYHYVCVYIYICIYVYVQDRGAARGSAFWLRRASVFCILGFRRNGRIAYEICFQNTKPWTPKPKSDMKP